MCSTQPIIFDEDSYSELFNHMGDEIVEDDYTEEGIDRIIMKPNHFTDEEMKKIIMGIETENPETQTILIQEEEEEAMDDDDTIRSTQPSNTSALISGITTAEIHSTPNNVRRIPTPATRKRIMGNNTRLSKKKKEAAKKKLKKNLTNRFEQEKCSVDHEEFTYSAKTLAFHAKVIESVRSVTDPYWRKIHDQLAQVLSLRSGSDLKRRNITIQMGDKLSIVLVFNYITKYFDKIYLNSGGINGNIGVTSTQMLQLVHTYETKFNVSIKPKDRPVQHEPCINLQISRDMTHMNITEGPRTFKIPRVMEPALRYCMNQAGFLASLGCQTESLLEKTLAYHTKICDSCICSNFAAKIRMNTICYYYEECRKMGTMCVPFYDLLYSIVDGYSICNKECEKIGIM